MSIFKNTVAFERCKICNAEVFDFLFDVCIECDKKLVKKVQKLDKEKIDELLELLSKSGLLLGNRGIDSN